MTNWITRGNGGAERPWAGDTRLVAYRLSAGPDRGAWRWMLEDPHANVKMMPPRSHTTAQAAMDAADAWAGRIEDSILVGRY